MTDPRPVTDLASRRAARDAALAGAASAPVLHVTQAFLDALNCRGEWAPDGDDATPPRRLHAV